MNWGLVLLGVGVLAALVAVSFTLGPRHHERDIEPEQDAMPPQRPYTMTVEVLPQSWERLPYDGNGLMLDSGEEEPDGLP